MRKFIEICSQGKQGSGIKMTTTGHGETHAKKQDAITAVFHAIYQVFYHFQGNTCFFFNRSIYFMSLYQGTEGPE